MDVRQETINADGRILLALVLSPESAATESYDALWIHGGGYVAVAKALVLSTRAVDIVEKFGCTVIAPDYSSHRHIRTQPLSMIATRRYCGLRKMPYA